VITNGRQEVHAHTLTSVCKSGICFRLTGAERRDWPVMSRDQVGHVDYSAWNAVNASSLDVFVSGAHRLDKMLIR